MGMLSGGGVLIALLVALSLLPGVSAGCCANPSLVTQAGFTESDVCALRTIVTSSVCCPNDPAYYNSTESPSWVPDSQADCLANYFHGTDCSALQRCGAGCCFDVTKTGGFSDVCYGDTQTVCRLGAAQNAWTLGWQNASEQFQQGNPCYSTSYVAALAQCPLITECSRYDNDLIGCTGANLSCFHCPDIGPTNGAGRCFSACAGNCLGWPVDYSVNDNTTEECAQPEGAQTPCVSSRCQSAEPDCLCATGVTNATHPYCCQIRGDVFDNSSRCLTDCQPDCVLNASIATSASYYAPSYTDCFCGAQKVRLTDPGYCCAYSSGTVWNLTACFDAGSLNGYVRSQAGTGLAGASVSIAGQTAQTDANGFYNFPQLFVGGYQAVASAAGYGAQNASVLIVKNTATTQDFALVASTPACTDPGQPRPNPQFAASCAKGDNAVILTWVKPCSNIRAMRILRNGLPIVAFFGNEMSYLDGSLNWNTRYNYTLAVEYDGITVAGTFQYNTTGRTGDIRCANITTPSDCLNLTGGTGGYTDTLIGCDDCNMVQYLYGCANLTGLPSALCVGPNAQGQSRCLDSPNCGALGNPFGLFATESLCLGTGQAIGYACYYDSSSTVTDACYSCTGISSCFGYRSENACTQDSCGVSYTGPCQWQYLNQELGKGICFAPGYNGTEYCGLCNDPLLPCDSTICERLGNCYTTGGSCGACAPGITCRDFVTEEGCTAGRDFVVDAQCPAASTPSGNPCGLIYCMWDGSRCIKDVDGDGLEDPFLDSSPPFTSIANPPLNVVNQSGYLLKLNVSDLYTTTYFCVDDTDSCCPNRIVMDGEVMLPAGMAGQGLFYLRYYSKKNLVNNIELIKSMPFYLDTLPPSILVTYVITDNAQPLLSDIDFTIRVSEYARCTDSFRPATYSASTPISSALNNRFTSRYEGLEDFTYYYTVNCTDLQGLSLSNYSVIDVDRVQFIFGESPVGVTTAQTSMVLSVRTTDTATCRYARLDSNYVPGTYQNFALTGGTTHQSTLSSLAQGTYEYRVVCQGAVLLDTAYLGFTVDLTPPVTTPYFDSPSGGRESMQANGWYPYARFFLECKDPDQGPPEEFGCLRTMYCSGSQPSCTPSTQINWYNATLSSGTYALCYSSTDGYNAESARCTPFRVDATPPTSPQFNVSGYWPQLDRFSFSVLSTDANSGLSHYLVSLVDANDTAVVDWRSVPAASNWTLVQMMQNDADWLGANGTNELIEGETYYVLAVAYDNSGLASTMARSSGTLIVGVNFTPPHCSDGIRDFDETGIDCGGSCLPCGICGNGNLEPGEECDGPDWGAVSNCDDLGFLGGALSCRQDCFFDTTGCIPQGGSYCGDGILNSGEQCDGPSWGIIRGCTDFDQFTSGLLTCGSNCRFDTSGCMGGAGGYCGNGVIDGGEQ